MENLTVPEWVIAEYKLPADFNDLDVIDQAYYIGQLCSLEAAIARHKEIHGNGANNEQCACSGKETVQIMTSVDSENSGANELVYNTNVIDEAPEKDKKHTESAETVVSECEAISQSSVSQPGSSKTARNKGTKAKQKSNSRNQTNTTKKQAVEIEDSERNEQNQKDSKKSESVVKKQQKIIKQVEDDQKIHKNDIETQEQPREKPGKKQKQTKKKIAEPLKEQLPNPEDRDKPKKEENIDNNDIQENQLDQNRKQQSGTSKKNIQTSKSGRTRNTKQNQSKKTTELPSNSNDKDNVQDNTNCSTASKATLPFADLPVNTAKTPQRSVKFADMSSENSPCNKYNLRNSKDSESVVKNKISNSKHDIKTQEQIVQKSGKTQKQCKENPKVNDIPKNRSNDNEQQPSTSKKDNELVSKSGRKKNARQGQVNKVPEESKQDYLSHASSSKDVILTDTFSPRKTRATRKAQNKSPTEKTTELPMPLPVIHDIKITVPKKDQKISNKNKLQITHNNAMTGKSGTSEANTTNSSLKSTSLESPSLQFNDSPFNIFINQDSQKANKEVEEVSSKKTTTKSKYLRNNNIFTKPNKKRNWNKKVLFHEDSSSQVELKELSQTDKMPVRQENTSKYVTPQSQMIANFQSMQAHISRKYTKLCTGYDLMNASLNLSEERAQEKESNTKSRKRTLGLNIDL